MVQEAKVKVRLDTGQAQGELSNLTRNVAAVGKRIGGGVAGVLGSGLRAVGLGGGIGIAMSALSGPSQNAASSVIGEAIGPLGKQLETWMFGDLAPQARADARAREATIEAFRYQGATDASAAFFQNMRQLYTPEEVGRQAIESDPRFYGARPEDVLERIINKMVEAVKAGASYIAGRLSPF